MSQHYLINLPHSATHIPDAFLDDYYLGKEELEANIFEYADLYTDVLFSDFFETFGGVKAKYSRLLCDIERFFDDEAEPMHKKFKLGWFYENAILSHTPLRSTKNREVIAKYYENYHRKLNQKTAQKLKEHGQCTIIDCHSFSNEFYWFLDESLHLPDICIGFDEYHKDPLLVEAILSEFKEYDIGINEPYAGSLVPINYWQKERRVKSVMIEINKKLYLKEDNRTKSAHFSTMKEKLNNVLKILSDAG
jgi:N-formylglutamate amidohydrolase